MKQFLFALGLITMLQSSASAEPRGAADVSVGVQSKRTLSTRTRTVRIVRSTPVTPRSGLLDPWAPSSTAAPASLLLDPWAASPQRDDTTRAVRMRAQRTQR